MVKRSGNRRTARFSRDEKIAIIASTHWLPYYQTDAGIRPQDMVAIVKSDYQVTSTDQDVIAVMIRGQAYYVTNYPESLPNPVRI